MDKKSKVQSSQSQYGTMTATQDANNDYTSSKQNQKNKNQSSAAQFGTMTATQDANNDYTSSNNQ